jgi:hypothetical protein
MRGAFVPGQQRPSFQPRKARSKGTPPTPNADINVAQDALATHRGVAEYHADVISHLVRQKGLSAEHEVLSAMFPRYLAFSLAHSRSLSACPPFEALGRSSDLILQLAGAQGIIQPIKTPLTLAGT